MLKGILIGIAITLVVEAAVIFWKLRNTWKWGL